MGTETTWGNLRALLGQLDGARAHRVMLGDSTGTLYIRNFEISAGNLAGAINVVKHLSGKGNVKSRSTFIGGILVRTYLQSFGTTHSNST